MVFFLKIKDSYIYHAHRWWLVIAKSRLRQDHMTRNQDIYISYIMCCYKYK